MQISALLSPASPGALSPARQTLLNRAPTPVTLQKVARERERVQQEEFRRNLTKSMGLRKVTADKMRLLPDPETAMAQRSDAEWTKKRRYGDAEAKGQVECVKRIALGGKVTQQEARLVGVSLSMLEEQADKVKASGARMDTEDSKAFTRAAAEAAGVAHTGQYTEEEYDLCIVDALKGRQPQTKLTEKYGVSRPTMQRGMKRVREELQEQRPGLDASALMQLIDRTSDVDLRAVLTILREKGTIRKMGGAFLLTDTEIRTLFATVGVMRHCGIGKNSDIHRESAASALNQMGEKMLLAIERAEGRGEPVDEGERAKATRFARAKIDRKTWESWRQKYNAAGGVGPGTELDRGRKASKLSQARAKTNSKFLTEKMFAQIHMAIDQMIEDGVLKGGEGLEQELLERLMNLDECGFDPDGKKLKLMGFKGDQHPRVITTSEHAPFWVTAVITTSPKKAYAPFLIHQGQEDRINEMSVSCGDELSEDGTLKNKMPTWVGIAQTPSGYAVEGAHAKVAEHLCAQLPRNIKGHLLLMDAWEGHFSARAMEIFKENHVYIVFLRSQNSENDQPNDNGPNASLKSCFSREHAKWSGEVISRATMPLKPCHFNEVFLRAWNKFTDGTHEGAFQRGWEKCGLFPLNKQVALDREGADETGILFNATSSTTDAQLNGMMFPQVRGGKVHVPAVELAMQDGELRPHHVQVAAFGASREQVMVRQFVADLCTPAVRGATESVQAVAAMKSAKKTYHVDGVLMRKAGVPCTVSGLYWSAHVAAACEQAKAATAQEAEQAEQAAADKQRQKDARALARQQATEAVLLLLQANSQDWKRVQAQQLIDATNDLLRPDQPVNTKRDAVPALEAAVASGRFALPAS